MRKLLLVMTVSVMSLPLFASAAVAGPSCENFGDVCDEILHRPMSVLCNRYDLDCN